MARYLAALGLLTAPLALGGAHPPTNLLLAVLALLALGLVLWDHTPDLIVAWPGLAALAALFATLLQLVPLPLSVLQVVSPGTYAALSLSTGGAAGFAPVSVDVAMSSHEVLKLVALLCTAVLAADLTVNPKRLKELLAVLAVAGTCVVVVGGLHKLSGIEQTFGYFGPSRTSFVSTFINPNHLAGFLGFSSLVSLAGVFGKTGPRRWLFLGNTFLCGVAAFLTLSRGGILAFCAAILFLSLLLGLRRLSLGRPILTVQLGAASVLIGAGYLAYSRLVHEMWTLGRPEGFSKIAVWQPIGALLNDFPFLGVGRGALGVIYPRYKIWPDSLTFTHLENEVLQNLVDFGLIVGPILLGFLFLAFCRGLTLAGKDASRLTIIASLFFLGLHNLFDFNLALTGVALPALAIFSAYTFSPATDENQIPTWWQRLLSFKLTVAPKLAKLFWLFGLLLVCGASLPALFWRNEQDATRLTKVLRATELPQEEKAVAIKTILARHPADYLLPLIVAEYELRKPAPASALYWINRGLYLAPNYAAGHRLAARALILLGKREQALAEYRLAVTSDPNLAGAIASEVEKMTASVAAVVELAQGMSQDARRRMARVLFNRREFASVLGLLAEDLSENAEATDYDAGDLYLLARSNLELENWQQGLFLAKALEQKNPRLVDAYRLQATAHMRLGSDAEALAVLTRGSKLAQGAEALLQEKVELLLRQKSLIEARKQAEELLARSLDGTSAAAAHWLLGRVYRQEGQLALALREMRRARDSAPSNSFYRLHIAEVREQAGDLDGALYELEAALLVNGANFELTRAKARVTEKLQSRQSKTVEEHLMLE